MQAVAEGNYGLRVLLRVVDIGTNQAIIDTQGVWNDIGDAAPEWFNYGAVIMGRLGTIIDLPTIARPTKRSRWSKEDDKLLLDYYRQKLTVSEIAHNLGRTEKAVVKRRWRLAQSINS